LIARSIFAAATALIVGLGLSAPARAALIVSTGPNNQGTDNVISGGSCTAHIDEDVTGPAPFVVQGCLNVDHSRLVDMSTNNATGLHYGSGGQAVVVGGPDGTPDLFGDLKIYFDDGGTFAKLVLNINMAQRESGYVQFSDGTSTSALFALGNGSNFFTITNGGFSFISFQTYSDAAGSTPVEIVENVKQIRIGGPGIEVPEPGTLALLGFALAGFGFRRRRILT
jgi:hypothetical protein